MLIDPDAIAPWFSLASMIIAISGVIYTWLTSGSKKNAEALLDVQKDITKQDKRLQDLENEIKNMPHKDLVHQLQLSIVEMSGDLKVMAQSTTATSASVKRLEDWALSQSTEK